MALTMRTERKLNKLLSAAGIFLVVIGILLISAVTVPAAETNGSLTLRCVFPVGDGERILSKDEYSLVKIADAVVTDTSVTYTTRSDFKSYDCDWRRISASAMNAKAKSLAYYCKQNGLYTEARTTDKNGECFFGNLEIGLYLVARTKTDPENDDFTTDPLLFFLPQSVNGETIYEIVATPKFSYISAIDPIDSPGGKTHSGDNTLPQTGQLLWPVTLLSVLGCLMILAGSFLLRKEGLGEKKDC
jgi:hypothetical protein